MLTKVGSRSELNRPLNATDVDHDFLGTVSRRCAQPAACCHVLSYVSVVVGLRGRTLTIVAAGWCWCWRWRSGTSGHRLTHSRSKCLYTYAMREYVGRRRVPSSRGSVPCARLTVQSVPRASGSTHWTTGGRSGPDAFASPGNRHVQPETKAGVWPVYAWRLTRVPCDGPRAGERESDKAVKPRRSVRASQPFPWSDRFCGHKLDSTFSAYPRSPWFRVEHRAGCGTVAISRAAVLEVLPRYRTSRAA